MTREEAKRAMLFAKREVMADSYIDKAYDVAIKALGEPERKKGKWIHDGYFHKGGIDWMHCSECGHKDQWDIVTRTPFCGWCGAKMEEGEQDGQTN